MDACREVYHIPCSDAKIFQQGHSDHGSNGGSGVPDGDGPVRVGKCSVSDMKVLCNDQTRRGYRGGVQADEQDDGSYEQGNPPLLWLGPIVRIIRMPFPSIAGVFERVIRRGRCRSADESVIRESVIRHCKTKKVVACGRFICSCFVPPCIDGCSKGRVRKCTDQVSSTLPLPFFDCSFEPLNSDSRVGEGR